MAAQASQIGGFANWRVGELADWQVHKSCGLNHSQTVDPDEELILAKR
jgi:hypothetical protein